MTVVIHFKIIQPYIIQLLAMLGELSSGWFFFLLSIWHHCSWCGKVLLQIYWDVALLCRSTQGNYSSFRKVWYLYHSEYPMWFWHTVQNYLDSSRYLLCMKYSNSWIDFIMICICSEQKWNMNNTVLTLSSLNMFCEWAFIKERVSKWLREIKILVFIIYVVFIEVGVYFCPFSYAVIKVWFFF